MTNEKAAIPERWEEEYLISCSYQDAAHVLNKRLIEELARAESERDALRAQVEAMRVPVGEHEWSDALTLGRSIYMTDAERATQIIADRLAKPISAPAADGGAE